MMSSTWPKRIDCGQCRNEPFRMAGKQASENAKSTRVFGQPPRMFRGAHMPAYPRTTNGPSRCKIPVPAEIARVAAFEKLLAALWTHRRRLVPPQLKPPRSTTSMMFRG